MVNPFYSPGEQRAAKVQELFARIASRYDLINDFQSFGLHRYWKSRLIRLAAPGAGQTALDVCCGTGDLAYALAKRGACVMGLDFSEPMLAHALAKETNGRCCGLLQEVNPQFVRGDALELPFPNNSFEILTVGYGLRNLSDFNAGLREMLRVTKPAGRVLILDFGKPDNATWRSIYFGYLRLFVPFLGLLFCGNSKAYGYILESLKHYPAQNGVAEIMRSLGFQQVRIYSFLAGVMTINYGEKPRKPASEPTSRAVPDSAGNV